jgi:hypothetical protein
MFQSLQFRRCVLATALVSLAAAVLAAVTRAVLTPLSEAREYFEVGAVAAVVAVLVTQLMLGRPCGEEWQRALVFAGGMVVLFPLGYSFYVLVAYSALFLVAVLAYALLYSLLMFVPWLILGRLWAGWVGGGR